VLKGSAEDWTTLGALTLRGEVDWHAKVPELPEVLVRSFLSWEHGLMFRPGEEVYVADTPRGVMVVSRSRGRAYRKTYRLEAPFMLPAGIASQVYTNRAGARQVIGEGVWVHGPISSYLHPFSTAVKAAERYAKTTLRWTNLWALGNVGRGVEGNHERPVER